MTHRPPTSDIPSALIRRYREDEGLSRTAFAAQLGVDTSTVARWETGKAAPTGTAALVLRTLTAKYRPLPFPSHAVAAGVAAGAAIGCVPLASALVGMLAKSIHELQHADPNGGEE